VQAILDLLAEHEVEEVVLGLPLSSEGEESDWTAEVRAFGEAVARRGAVAVHYLDERFTSARAERAIREAGLKKKEREEKERVDATAAVLILQAYLDRRKYVAS
jgi:putative Holliday junction resolvase